MKKLIKNLLNCLMTIVFLVGITYTVIGLSNLIEPMFKWASGFISFIVCLGVIFYFGYDLEKKIKADDKILIDKYKMYLNVINIINKFDYSQLNVISNIIYKDDKFYIVIKKIDYLITESNAFKFLNDNNIEKIDNFLISNKLFDLNNNSVIAICIEDAFSYI